MLNPASILATMLAGALASGAVPPPRPIDEFSPARDGFAFVNRFTGSSLPGPLVLLHNAVNAPGEFGLCGGMCFAAADFFLARRAIPAQDTQPTRGQPLYEYIYQRQVDSFGERMTFAAKFARWMNLPDSGPLAAGRVTLTELEPMLDALARHEPVHIGLVYVNSQKTREPWHNHQVLATGGQLAPETPGGVTGCSLSIYDPNYPGNNAVRIDVQLILDGFDRMGHDRVPIIGARCTQVIGPTPGRAERTRNVRGMFPMPYEAKAPPENLR